MFQVSRLGEESHRRPWATYGIALGLVLLFLGTQISARRRVNHGLSQLERAVAYHAGHPGIRPDPRLLPFLHSPGSNPAPLPLPRPNGRNPAPRFKALEQVEADGFTRGGFDTLASTPFWHWGVVPRRLSLVNLFTYPFFHASFLPLVLNLALLLLCGPTLEADWGRPFHVSFLWISAAIGGAIFATANLSLEAALVGPSAAVAALVTAYLFRHWRGTLQPFFFAPSARWSSVALSSPAILGVWLLREGVTPWAPDLVALPGIGGAELWAHAGGTLFGAGIASALRWGGLEERYLRRFAPPPAERPQPTISPSQRTLGQSGNRADWEELLREARATQDPSALEAAWEMAVEKGHVEEIAPLLLTRIRDAVHGTNPLGAFEQWCRLKDQCAQAALPLSLETRLAEALETADHRDEAARVLRSAIQRATPKTAAATLNRLLRLASGPERVQVEALARTAAERSPELQAELSRPLQGPTPSPPRGSDDSEPSEPASSQDEAGRGFRPVYARPLALRDGRLTVELGAGVRRALRLERVYAMGAAAIDEGGADAKLVLDLFLQAPGGRVPPPKSLRLDTHGFDPRALVSDNVGLEDAFRSIIEAVLAASGAAWLLAKGPETLPRYAALSAYDDELRRALPLYPR